jgi:hypothetical protein
MILGLLKLMHRLCLAGYQTESQLSFKLYSIIGSGLVSKKQDVTDLGLRIFTSATGIGA